MARGKAGQQQAFETPEDGSWEEQIPDAVKEAADDYIKALRAKAKAQEKLNTAREDCIEAMKEHDVHRVRIDEGQKWLVHEGKDALKTEKIRAPSELPPEPAGV